MHLKDKMELHKKVLDVLHRDVTKTHANVKKLQDALGKVEKQLRQEKVITRARFGLFS